jgi:hypothetical protein
MDATSGWAALGLEEIADSLLKLRAAAGSKSVEVRVELGGDRCGPAGLLPPATWRKLFHDAGWRETRPASVRRLRRRRLPLAAGRIGRFGKWLERFLPATAAAGPNQILTLSLEAEGAVDEVAVRERIAKRLDIEYRTRKRRQFAGAAAVRLGLNVHLFQDFLNLRPILETADPARVVVFMRREAMPADAAWAVRNAVASRGIVLREYDRVRDLGDSAWEIDALCSITEGAGHLVHCLGRQLVEAARLRGIPTLVFQHGIRVQLPVDRFVEFGSDTHISWGGEHAELLEAAHQVAGLATTVGGGVRGAARFRDRPLGSPKFADSLLPGSGAALDDRLGVRTADYRRTVLFGTNLRWSAHTARRGSIIPDLCRLIDSHPDLLFIVKTHPNERVSDYRKALRKNSLVFDDVLLTRMDLSISRLVRVADLVVSSLSTLLLDAAVAGKPFLLFDTGNEYTYRHVTAIPFQQLDGQMRRFKEGLLEMPAGLDPAKFREHYAAAEHGRFYEQLAAFLGSKDNLADCRRDDRAEAAASYSLCSVIEEFTRGRRAA